MNQNLVFFGPVRVKGVDLLGECRENCVTPQNFYISDFLTLGVNIYDYFDVCRMQTFFPNSVEW